jgi:hypothetical protein
MNNLIFKEKGHEYRVDGVRVPCVSDILQEGGFVDFSYVPTTTLNRSMDFGSDVHLMTKYYDLGTLDLETLHPNLMPYLEGYKKFLKENDIKFKPEEVEIPMYSKVWKFAGTPDRFRIFNGKLYELKSGVMLPSAKLQSAAYAVLVEENICKIKERLGVQILPNDYKMFPYKDTTDKGVFLGAVLGYHFRQKHNLLKKEK